MDYDVDTFVNNDAEFEFTITISEGLDIDTRLDVYFTGLLSKLNNS